MSDPLASACLFRSELIKRLTISIKVFNTSVLLHFQHFLFFFLYFRFFFLLFFVRAEKCCLLWFQFQRCLQIFLGSIFSFFLRICCLWACVLFGIGDAKWKQLSKSLNLWKCYAITTTSWMPRRPPPPPRHVMPHTPPPLLCPAICFGCP